MEPSPLLAIAAVAAGYLLGALPFGHWVSRARGVDIFSVGSGNPGATNVKRCVGKAWGNLVFALDVLKGFAAASWALWLPGGEEAALLLGGLGLGAAVLGHAFSVFTRFRGGKGVATLLGGVAALMPLAAAAGVAVWLAVFCATGYVSLASLCLAVSLPATNWATGRNLWLTLFSLLLAVVVVVRHRSNIARLRRGEEHRFERPLSRRPASRESGKGAARKEGR